VARLNSVGIAFARILNWAKFLNDTRSCS